MAEETVYSDNTVSVTTTRIIITGTTYALRNITSVKMATTPAKNGCAIMLLLFGILALLGTLPVLSESAAGGMVGVLFAGGIIAGAIFWIQNCKPSYHVAIASASGEARALTSKDKAYIENIVASINDAIVRYQ